MRFKTHSHRYANVVLKQPGFKEDYAEITNVIRGISDQDIIEEHESSIDDGLNPVSISIAINSLLKQRFVKKGWKAESPIFQDPEYTEGREKRWRLDFAKKDISIEVAFNHGEAIAWNLIKPVLASELNHVRKDVQTKVGVIITATKGMKKAGRFDGAVGEYEKHLRYLKPFNNILTVPMMIIGLKAPRAFRIARYKVDGKDVSVVEKLLPM